MASQNDMQQTESKPVSQESSHWWAEGYGFFGSFYMEGDASLSGYLVEKQQSINERTTVEVEGVIGLLSITPGDKILDCPCGYGRHSIALAKRGFDVVGSDINSSHLEAALYSASAGELKPKFVQENMLDIQYDGTFDAVINMFYSFGFFDGDVENERVLGNFFRALKPRGKFLMHTDVNIPRIRSKKYKEDEIRPLTSGRELRIRDEYVEEDKRIHGSWTIISEDGEETKSYSVRVYTREEFRDMCFKAGFSSVEVYSDWDGSPYSFDSEDMIIVATK